MWEIGEIRRNKGGRGEHLTCHQCLLPSAESGNILCNKSSQKL